MERRSEREEVKISKTAFKVRHSHMIAETVIIVLFYSVVLYGGQEVRPANSPVR